MTHVPSGYRPALWCCIVGAVVAVALTIVLRPLLGTKLLAEVVLDATTDGSSPEDFSFLLRTLEDLARPLLFVSVVLAQIAIYVSVWRRTEPLLGHVRGLPTRELAVVFACTAVFAGITALLGVLFDTGLGSRTSWPEYVLVSLIVSIVFAGVSRGLESWDATIAGVPQDPARRLFLGKGPAIAIGALAVYVVGAQVLNTKKGGTEQFAHPGKRTAEVTPNSEFYVVSKNLIDPPEVDIGSWRLRVSGTVNAPAEFTIEQIRALPAVEQFATFQCISNEVGGYLMGTALWKGVLLRDLLAAVQIRSDARHIWFESTDDYTEDLPVEYAAMDGVMLAYEMNGEELPQDHGYPLRLVAPGKYGMKQPKWIRSMTLRSEADEGYWARRGWDTEADMQTSSRIDVPADGDAIAARSLRIEGVAFSGRRGIQRVEVSTDGGSTWHEAAFDPPLSAYTWVLWRYDWTDVPSMPVTIQARATDGRGVVQTATKAFPFPKGASGYPEVEITGRG